ncbi:MAG: P-II family nitrogen regulator [Blastopirellula sp. JB062]
MFTTKNARRVTIVLDAAVKGLMLEKISELGVRCYSLMNCSGHGRHAVTGDLYNGDDLLRLEIVTTTETGAKILDWIHAAQFAQLSQYPLFAYADYVEVDERDQSFRGER